jgi:hypothetical protein
MALPRINAIVPVPLLRALSDATPRPLPAAGDTLQLALERIAGDELIGTLAEGAPLRLTGLSAIASSLQRGDELLLRVVSTTPSLELQLIEARSKSRDDGGGTSRSFAGDASEELAALRPDLAAIRTLVRRPLDAVSIARAWQSRIAAPDTLPAPLADDSVPALPAPPSTSLALAPAAWRWQVPMDAFGATGLLLLVDGADDERARARPRRGGTGLRLEFALVAVGRVVLQVQPAAAGLVLVVGVDGEAAWQVVQPEFHEIESALATLGVRVAASRLEPSLAAARRTPPIAPEAGALPTSVVFRAAAEAALTLAASLSPPGFGR